MKTPVKVVGVVAGATVVAGLVAQGLPGAQGATRFSGNPVAGNSGFNVVVEGDAAVASNESEGTMAVGGNLAVTGGYRVAAHGAGTFTVPGDAHPTALVVGGRLDWPGSTPGGSLQVLAQGYVKVGDLTGSSVLTTDQNNAQVNTQINGGGGYGSAPRVELTVQQPAPSVGPASPLDFGPMFTAYRERATELAGCTANVDLRDGDGRPLPAQGIPAGTNARISLTDGRTNVLKLKAEDLANIGILTFDTPPTATAPLLVVVDTAGVGDSFTWAVPNFAGIGGPEARYILFDFPTATSLTLPAAQGGTVEATVFAPRAHLTDLNPANIEGDVIVQRLTHGSAAADGGEFHSFPFSTTLSCGNNPGGTLTPTPTGTSPTPTGTSPTGTPFTPTIPPTSGTPTVTTTPVTGTPTPTGTSPTPTPTVTSPTPTPTTPASPTPTVPAPGTGRLVVDKIVDKRVVRVGRKVHYELRVQNVGAARLTDAAFTDDLTSVLRHARLTGKARTTSGRLTRTGRTLRWTGTLDPRQTATISFTVTTTRIGPMTNGVTWSTGRDRVRTHVTPPGSK